MSDVKLDLFIEVLERFQNLCTHCGECCKESAYFLNDLEAHVIYNELHKKGGFEMVQKHFRFNPRPWGKFTRFLFVSEGLCPFHEKDRCSIYLKRPSMCRLFPLAAIAFVDNEDTVLRQPLFTLYLGHDSFACRGETQQIIDRIQSFMQFDHKIDRLMMENIALYNLDEMGFSFFYGQECERGIKAFKLKGVLDASLIEGLYLDQFVQTYELPKDSTSTWTIPITKKHLKKFFSQKAIQKSLEIQRKRKSRIKKHSPDLWNIYKDYKETQRLFGSGRQDEIC